MLVADLQSDLIGLDAARLAAPQREAGRYVALPGLTPEVEGRRRLARVQQAAAVPGGALGPPVASLEHARDVLTRALDILIDGV